MPTYALPSVDNDDDGLYGLDSLLTRPSGDHSSFFDAVRARNICFVFVFMWSVSWGCFTETCEQLYPTDRPAPEGHFGLSKSSLGLVLMQITSFVCVPIVSTLSDSVGRKPMLAISACCTFVTGIVIGLVPRQWVFLLMCTIQGCFGRLSSVAYALLADFVAMAPVGFSGGASDDLLHRCLFKGLRVLTASKQTENCIEPSNESKMIELNLLFT